MFHSGILYLIAAPIGNLEDISPRACRLLNAVAVVAAEDTRRARQLLSALGIRGKKILSLRARNENIAAARFIEIIKQNGDGAYLSDAGTPGISDPGARLVAAAVVAGIKITPVPGACALAVLLSAAGLSDGAIHFFGFPPKKQRRDFFAELATLQGVAVFFESPKRIVSSVADLAKIWGGDCRAVLGREMTKMHEQIVHSSLAGILKMFEDGDIAERGEFSLAVESPNKKAATVAGEKLFAALIKEMPPRKAAKIAAQFGEVSAAALYKKHAGK